MTYLDLLLKWNDKINLTSIREKEDIIQKHFIDSVKIYKFTPLILSKNIIDIGTGAGFPGIPMKIANEDINITLVDSTLKKINFLKEVILNLNLSNCHPLQERAENLCKDANYREKFDCVVSRAVANLTLLSEICLPLVKIHGHFIALKGPSVLEEIKEASDNIRAIGGKVIDLLEIVIEDSDYKHNILVIEKVKNTPVIFPRRIKSLGKKIK